MDIRGSARRLPKRKLSEETCQKYRIYVDDQQLLFYYCDDSGIVRGAKTKTPDKEFRYEGEVTGTLFGQHLFPPTGKRVVITEGELDAAACYESMPNWPMVSLPNGAAAAKKAVKAAIPWLQGYEEIVLFFDNDEAGQHAAAEAASKPPEDAPEAEEPAED